MGYPVTVRSAVIMALALLLPPLYWEVPVADFYQSNPNTGVAGLGQQPNLQQLLASLRAGQAARSSTPAGAAPAAAPAAAEAPRGGPGPQATGQQGAPGTGPLSDNGIAGAAQSFVGRIVAAQPSLMNSLKIAGMIPGFGPMSLLGPALGMATGLSGNPLNPPGQTLSPQDQQAIQAAYMSGGIPAATAALQAARARAMTSAAGMQSFGGPAGSAVDPSGNPAVGSNVGAALGAGTSLGTAAANNAMAGMNRGVAPAGRAVDPNGNPVAGNYGGSGPPGGGGMASGAPGGWGAGAMGAGSNPHGPPGPR